MIKQTESSNNYLKPIISARFSPNNSKNISVIDSLSISGGMGLIVSYAAEAANLGYSKSLPHRRIYIHHR